VHLTVLVVRDDQPLASALKRAMLGEWPDCEVACAMTPTDAVGYFAAPETEPDLVVLDLSRSREDGYDALRRIRRRSDVPILLIAGEAFELEQVRGLQLGADDCIPKPFTARLFVARIKSLLRRTNRGARPHVVGDRIAGPLQIDFQNHEVKLHGQPVSLTPTEYKLLYHLARHPGRLLSQVELLQLVWGSEARTKRGRLHVYMKRLRDKIEANTHFIENERGLGYRFIRPPNPLRVAQPHASDAGAAPSVARTTPAAIRS
jgi:two-component system KDP operon response regulator KdpE